LVFDTREVIKEYEKYELIKAITNSVDNILAFTSFTSMHSLILLSVLWASLRHWLLVAYFADYNGEFGGAKYIKCILAR